MSIIIYILIIGGFGLFMGRHYLKGFYISYIEKKNKKEKIKTVNPDLIYVPVRSSRVFNFSIEIDETGDGTASISVIKTKV